MVKGNREVVEFMVGHKGDVRAAVYHVRNGLHRGEYVYDWEWVIVAWKVPLGLRSCGFFHVIDGRIKFQRGYWDKFTFLQQHHLPLPNA